MPQNEIPSSAQTPNTAEAVRAIFRRHARKLGKVLLTRGCHQMMRQQILLWTAQLQFLKRESRRKKRSKNYKRFVRDILSGVAMTQFGPFARLTGSDLATLEQLLDGLVKSMAGKPTLPQMQGKAFVSLQKKIFIQPAKRGPKNKPNLDEAFLRHLRGEETSSIARDMDPWGFADNPDRSMENFRRAFKRRERLLAKASDRT